MEKPGASPTPWLGAPHALAPLGEFLRAGAGADWVDPHGARGRISRRLLVREGIRRLWLFATDALLRLGALVALPLARESRSEPAGPLCLVLPVLPDLSHTFVYREVLALLRERPDARVICLERGLGPVHPVAAELLPRVEYVPLGGVTRRFVSVLRWLLRAPRRTGALLHLYRDRAGGSTGDLFGKNPLRDPRHPGRAFALADLLRARRPRHLHVYGSTYAANVTLGAALLLGRPFSISSYVDFDFPYEFKLLDQKLRRAGFFRVVTAFCADRLRQLEPAAATARIPVVRLGLDLARWQGRAGAPRRGVLLSAARLVPKKGLHLMPPALAELRRRGLPCRWLVAGDGPELPRLQALVAEHRLQDAVEFLGPVGNDEVERRLLGCDAAVLPCVVAADGERDGIPVFLTEAMALGVPVVTTAISGIPELIRDGDTGYLCAPGSVDALAARLAALLSDPAAAAAVGARGRALVHAELDVADAARALLREIDEAAA